MTRKSSTLSLGTESIGSLLPKYAIPAIIAMASTSIFHIVDSVFVGHGVGGAAIAGMAITMPIMTIATAFGAMVGVGSGARISIRLGEGNLRGAEKILCNAVVLNIVIGLTLSAVMLAFIDPILQLFSGGKASAETITYARQFLSIIICGNVITHMFLGMNDMIRASGYPRKAMFIILVSVGVNLVLNPLFIFRFGWGIRGSAIATVIAQVTAFSIALHHLRSEESFLHFKREAFRFEWRIVGSILSIGLAPFLLNTCASAIAALINFSLLRYGGTGAHDAVRGLADGGDIYVGTYGIVNRVALLFVMITLGLNQGMQPIVGYNFGAGNYARVRQALKLTAISGVCVMSVAFLLAETVPDYIARMFVDSSNGVTERNIISAVTQALPIVIAMFPLVGFQIVVNNFFQYIGHAPLAIFMSLTRQVLFLIPLIVFLAPRHGAFGIWISMPIADTASIVLATLLLIHQLRRMPSSRQ